MTTVIASVSAQASQLPSGDVLMRFSPISPVFRFCLFIFALTISVARAQTTAHSRTATGARTNSVADQQTDTVTAATDKQGRPLPSPRHKLDFTQRHNDVKVHIVITYGAPSLRGRTFDEIVPSSRWWRAGANEATSLTTDRALRIGDLAVAAGSYTLYVQPDQAGWQLIVNKQTGQWGTQYDQAQDLGRVAMTATPVSSPQELLKYHFDHVTDDSATLHLRWGGKDESVVVNFAGSRL